MIHFPPNTPSNCVDVCIFNLSLVTVGIAQNVDVPIFVFKLSAVNRHLDGSYFPANNNRKKKVPGKFS